MRLVLPLNALAFVIYSVMVAVVMAYPNFVKLIPNGDKVKFEGERWPAVGHAKVYGGGDLNAFGKDFMRAGNEWTEELCRKDSDEDGRYNGEELGDPDCTWKAGDPNPKTRFVTHPGVADECPSPAPAPSMMKIAVLGSGNVGKALHDAFIEAGIMASFGVRNKETHSAGGTVKTMQEAAEWGTVVVLAVPGDAVLDVVKELKPSLRGKIIIDCTNPLTWNKGPIWNPPSSGSNTAEVALLLPESKVVKAFNTMGVEHLEDPTRTGTQAQVFIAGDDSSAKRTVAQIAERINFKPIDVGPSRNAAALENLAILWIHLATVGGKGRDFVFATLP